MERMKAITAAALLISAAWAGRVQAQDLLRLHEKKYWSEELTWADSAAIAIEEFSYNEPNMIDEEHSHIVYFKFHRPMAELLGKVIELPKDSGLVSVRYELSSVWFWRGPVRINMRGTLRVIAVDERGPTLDHDLRFVGPDDPSDKFMLRGRRSLSKGKLPSTGWRKEEGWNF